ncbi:MAG: Spy/CpxP family protein refolding chaperone [Bryobacteraceae bacterium]
MRQMWKWMVGVAVAGVILSLPVHAQRGMGGPGFGPRWGAGPAGASQGQPAAPAALKEYLGLTDQQVQQLLDLRRQAAEDNRGVVEQIRAKRQELATLMQTANPDPAKAGQLLVDIRKLEDQRRARLDEFRTKALGLLTAEQKQKLAELEKALTLGPAARQAVGLGLIAPPRQGAGMMGGAGPLAPMRGARLRALRRAQGRA